jgi:ATP-binding cassette subfamily B protein
VAIVFQDFLRFQFSAGENIALGRIEAATDFERILAAARRAGASDFISRLPDGYSSLLGSEFEAGSDLSLGQWQRIVLARAFFRNAELVILDEPAASLDARSEHQLYASIRELYQGRSVLLITHRLASVRTADRIYVLKEGEIVQDGCHEDLMRQTGLYSELFRLQASAYWPDVVTAATLVTRRPGREWNSSGNAQAQRP